MLLSIPYLHDTIKLASPKFPKPVITFLIDNVSHKKRHDGFKGILGLPWDSQRYYERYSFVRLYSASTKLSCNIYIHVQKHHI